MNPILTIKDYLTERRVQKEGLELRRDMYLAGVYCSLDHLERNGTEQDLIRDEMYANMLRSGQWIVAFDDISATRARGSGHKDDMGHYDGTDRHDETMLPAQNRLNEDMGLDNNIGSWLDASVSARRLAHAEYSRYIMKWSAGRSETPTIGTLAQASARL